jgi:hypothetical protein
MGGKDEKKLEETAAPPDTHHHHHEKPLSAIIMTARENSCDQLNLCPIMSRSFLSYHDAKSSPLM